MVDTDVRKLKKLTVCIENENKEDVVIIFAEPSLKELENLVKDDLVFHLVNDLLWVNKEEEQEFEEGELKREEHVEENSDNGGGICEELSGGFEEKKQKKEGNVDIEQRQKGFLGANIVVTRKKVSSREEYASRKGEELWLEMWRKEMESREMEREKKRTFSENQRSQLKTEDFGEIFNDTNLLESHESKLFNLLVQSMDGDPDTNNQFDLDYSIKDEVKNQDEFENQDEFHNQDEFENQDELKNQEEVQNQDEKKMFPCDICGSFLSTIKSLKRHRKIHSKGITKPEKKKDLNLSDSTFRKSDGYFRDKKSDSAVIKKESKNSTDDKKQEVQKEFPCEFCGKILLRRKTLNEHRKIHTGRIPKECDICGKKAYGTSNFKVHMRTHTGERPYVCDVCGNAFISTSQLICHKRIHTGEKPYSCDICKREFADISSCKRHKKTHTGEKPYSCDECGKLFTASQTLKEHKRSHAGEKLSYPCVVCGKAFSFKRNLNRHKKIHTGEKRK